LARVKKDDELMSLLSDFISEVKVSGLMRTARYSVLMPFIISTTEENKDPRLVSMFCDQVQIPGLNYNTAPNLTYGETREAPYQRMYDNLSLSFYVDNEMKVKKYFDDWQYSIQNPVTRSFNYYANYIKPIQIGVEDIASKTKYMVELRECYPKTVGAIQMDSASKDLMKLSVTLAYKYWIPIGGYTYDDTDLLNKTNDGLFSEIAGVFNGIASSPVGGLLMNYGLTGLQNKLTTIAGYNA
jgi:hypothetical protein